VLAFVGQKFVVGHRQFLTTHFTHRQPSSEISPRIHLADSAAVLVNLGSTPVQLHTKQFQTADPRGEEFFVLIGTCWRRPETPDARYPPSAFVSSLCIWALQ
jgi:hypothetical protein